jgi:hypothetical protein
MRPLTAILITLCTALVLGTLSPKALANESNKKTIITFNNPVEVPGHVLLPGTYVFSLEGADSDTEPDRNVVQIYSEDHMHVVATVLTVSTSRLEAADKTTLTFEERRADTPMAINSWFYPGDLIGQEFLYRNHHTHSPSSSATR